jgi:hypothetical protein
MADTEMVPEEVSWRDPKRHLWMIGLVVPLLRI